MYLPPHFDQSDTAELLRTIDAFPFGAIIVNGPQGLDANHIPFFYDESEGKKRLIAHVARNNPLWRESTNGQEVLVIFRAGDAYISPNWYPTKHETHKLVPTWNYRVVHVHGKLSIHDDERFVRGVVARLTKKHESQTGDERPWKIMDSTPEFIDSMLANIVGIEVEVERMVGKWKLSQNRSERDRLNAAEELAKRGEETVSRAMKEAPQA